jgi:hypothetical protein
VQAEFFGHKKSANNEVTADGFEYIEYAGNIIDQRQVYGFNCGLIGKSPIGDDKRIRMADPTQEGIDLRVQDSRFQHHLGSLGQLGTGELRRWP